MADCSGWAALLVPAEAFHEARGHLPEVLAKRRANPDPALEALDEVGSLVQFVDRGHYRHLRDEALERIGRRDSDDWPVLALVLAADSPVWTEDQDFFGTGVATWTTDRVEIFLRNAARE
jgi:predicted nucleic acid-binding protein